MPENVIVRITIIARNAHGHIADLPRWAVGVDQEIRIALAQQDGADLEIDSLLIEYKLEGFAALTKDGRPA